MKSTVVFLISTPTIRTICGGHWEAGIRDVFKSNCTAEDNTYGEVEEIE